MAKIEIDVMSFRLLQSLRTFDFRAKTTDGIHFVRSFRVLLKSGLLAYEADTIVVSSVGKKFERLAVRDLERKDAVFAFECEWS